MFHNRTGSSDSPFITYSLVCDDACVTFDDLNAQ